MRQPAGTCLIMMILIIIMMLICDPVSGQLYVNRLNYGFLAEKITDTMVVSDYFKHSVHIALPEMDSFLRPVIQCNSTLGGANGSTNTLTSTGCVSYGIWSKLNSVWDTIISLLRDYERDINALIPQYSTRFGTPRRRVNRGLFNVIGSASSYLFGTTSFEEFQELKDDLEKLKQVSAGAIGSTTLMKSELSNFVTVRVPVTGN